MHTEKLASMGRMSTAVAHEIRNPLAAISQANALLEEDLSDPRHTRLTTMVAQNAQRLAKIVDDILNASRAQPRVGDLATQQIPLDETVQRICRDWTTQNQAESRLACTLVGQEVLIRFDGDHLRRVLFNLLDNASRFASQRAGSIQLETRATGEQQASVHVWSDGQPMDQTVERHLFEPFFSSESRSSGLGLYLCRELCEGHGASIAYRRSAHALEGVECQGNEFYISFVRVADPPPAPTENSVTPPWPITRF
jgi:two-component system, NtrC family, sensor histidine kinase PilS